LGHFVPHTDEEIAAMLDFMGLGTLEDLWTAVPEALRLAHGLDLASGASEFDVLAGMEAMAGRNRRTGSELVCFAGAGAYDHEIPAAVRRLAFRSEFVTAYTPYQPEVAQGVLQALFEYQTLLCRLTGVGVANASLYDGASACVEAANLAVAATGRGTLHVSQGVHPNWRAVMRTFAAGTGHDLRPLPLVDGVTPLPDGGGEPPAAILLQYPNYLGCLEDLAAAAAWARANDAMLLVAFDPVAAGLLRSPGSYGADVVVGEGQPFGTPLSLGGPYLGLFACRLEHVRRLPGRLVGETVDTEGRRAYVTTLRTREQDIRREKASSNVCTNQTLIAVCCAIQLAWLGTSGLRELALRCARATRYTRDALLALDGVEPAAPAPILREFAVRTPRPAETVIERMAEEGFLAGVALDDEYGGGLLVAVTERRTRAEIDAYTAAFEKVIS
jgi:glycine dehydrogenase subunit 1